MVILSGISTGMDSGVRGAPPTGSQRHLSAMSGFLVEAADCC